MPAAPAGQHDVPLLVAGQVRVCTRGATARKRVSDQRVRISSLGGGVLSRLSVAKRMRVRVFQEVRGPPPQRRLPAAAHHLPHAACCLPPAACRLPAVGCRLAPGTARLTLPRAWAQGDVLQAEGEPCEHMFCVADGEVRRFRKEGQSTVEVRRIADQHAVAHLPARPHADGHAGSGRHDVYVRHSALGAERALLRDGARNDRRQGVHSEQR